MSLPSFAIALQPLCPPAWERWPSTFILDMGSPPGGGLPFTGVTWGSLVEHHVRLPKLMSSVP